MAKFKVFPYRLHTSGGHVVQIYSAYSSPKEILEYLEEKTIVDIFWTTSSHGNKFVPMVLMARSIEIIAPVFGRSGLIVELDGLGNAVVTTAKSEEEELRQPVIGQSVKKRA